jgi:hypothetical protein
MRMKKKKKKNFMLETTIARPILAECCPHQSVPGTALKPGMRLDVCAVLGTRSNAATCAGQSTV